MIPPFIHPPEALWPILPEGVHEATLEEVKKVFGFNERRQEMLSGFEQALNNLFAANCPAVYLDGSFVTAKEIPGDYDAVWEPYRVDSSVLDPVFWDVYPPRSKQKAKYLGEFVPNLIEGNSGLRFDEYFQQLKDTNLKKGIIKITNSNVRTVQGGGAI